MTVEAARRCVSAHGFAVRELPIPLYARGRAAALVAAEYGSPHLDLRGEPIPLLDVAAAADADTALWELAAAAGRRRSGAPHVAADRVVDRAAVAALYRVLDDLADVTGPVRRIVGWEEAAPGPWRHPVDTAGGVACHLHGDVAGVPVVSATIRLGRTGREYAAVASDLSVPGAIRRALDGARRKLLLAGLVDPAGAAALPVPMPPVAGDVPLGQLRREPASRTELAALLVRHGLRPFLRVLGEDGQAAVVAARVDGGSPAGLPAPWARPDAAALRLSAPAHLSLCYDRSRVLAGRTYHEHSKLRAGFATLPRVDVRRMGVPTRHLIGRAYRDFPHARLRYRLAPSAAGPTDSLRELVAGRRSWAGMTAAPIGASALADVLCLANGVTGAGDAGDSIRLPLRATPAAGGLYAVDLFLLANRVEGVEPGLYYFHPARRELQLVRSDVGIGDVADLTGYGDRTRSAGAVAIYVAALRRTQWKYWERGYRMALLDCGHLAQSIVLHANAVGLVAHPMVAFVDDALNALVGVDGVDDAALYLTLLGSAAPRARREEAR